MHTYTLHKWPTMHVIHIPLAIACIPTIKNLGIEDQGSRIKDPVSKSNFVHFGFP